jgi:2-polyprenyl-6-methoxyphenol hydroxylase-like FAD-dependent oxidoreductase
LAEQLLGAAEWRDIGDARWLRRYQLARKEEVLLTQTTTDLLQKLFTLKLPALPDFLPKLRNTGLNLTNALPPVKNLLVKYALGTHPAFF